eukprot:15337913-Ditylum_brightwellii.AAC.1
MIGQRCARMNKLAKSYPNLVQFDIPFLPWLSAMTFYTFQDDSVVLENSIRDVTTSSQDEIETHCIDDRLECLHVRNG